MDRRNHLWKKSVAYGIMATLLLLLTYFAIVSFFQGREYAISRFVDLWYLMIPLVGGFGFQIGLFSYIRSYMQMSSGTAGMSGGVSAISMVACCAHHITDVIPILGFSALGIFLLEYQPVFLILGIVSNIIGILFMLDLAKKGRVKFRNSIFKSMVIYDYKALLKFSIIAGAVTVILLVSVIGYEIYQKNYSANYSNFVSSELEDKCSTPSGYTDETWREHMSHHPDRYEECLIR